MEAGTRRLVAIMFSDIAAYTVLMGKDEDLAVRVLGRSRSAIRTQVEKHGGRLLEEIGDGTLACFDSAVSAVECAREIQIIIGPDPDFDPAPIMVTTAGVVDRSSGKRSPLQPNK